MTEKLVTVSLTLRCSPKTADRLMRNVWLVQGCGSKEQTIVEWDHWDIWVAGTRCANGYAVSTEDLGFTASTLAEIQSEQFPSSSTIPTTRKTWRKGRIMQLMSGVMRA